MVFDGLVLLLSFSDNSYRPKKCQMQKKSLITALRITYVYINVPYITIRKFSVLGYVSRTKQPVIRISIFMLMIDWHILLCNYSLAT